MDEGFSAENTKGNAFRTYGASQGYFHVLLFLQKKPGKLVPSSTG